MWAKEAKWVPALGFMPTLRQAKGGTLQQPLRYGGVAAKLLGAKGLGARPLVRRERATPLIELSSN